ncbi:urea carboxylase [Rubritalea marina]|uniref:urea carboxylase n=1 Tax=Rubritalea marina TaxID=361055 RepID=UPI00036A5095|nr:urea carboxylase [Rubritalea marina]
MKKKVLIANRGAISSRILNTLKKLQIPSVVLYSDPDKEAPYVLEADEAIHLPGDTPQHTYLNADRIISEAKKLGVTAIHPGYGFLSENAKFAQQCATEGITFLGPTPAQLETCGLKHLCRDIAKQQGVPLLEGSELLSSAHEAIETAKAIGYPVIIKSSAGGGGIGMQVAYSPDEVADKFEQVVRLSDSNFSDSSVFIEKYIERARHIEVQLFGDGKGEVLTLGERDCSTQRRNQKVIEETPAPGLTDNEREALHSAASAIAKSVNYQSAGTVEFLWDDIARTFYFLEVNARLQVEHGVTEEVWGVDLVGWMIALGHGEMPALSSIILQPSGHAMQVRVYAEDPKKDFQPSTGFISHFRPPHRSRCDTWLQPGTEVSPFYDPMLAKIIVHRANRKAAQLALSAAVLDTELYGIESNLRFLHAVLESEAFQSGTIHTRFLNDFTYADRRIEVLKPGLETSIQDYPGRVGMWDVGVPPSGPFDTLHFRIANSILGNSADAAGMECSVQGPTLRFGCDTSICITGADMSPMLNDQHIARHTTIQVSEGDTLKLGLAEGAGQRCYIAFSGGLDAADYLGSKSTFRLGKFGGHAGRTLQHGDILQIQNRKNTQAENPLEPWALPTLDSHWEIHVNYGPHAAPEFFTPDDIETFFKSDWEVHYNSDRTGVRLIGPKPDWARSDGGEAGLHPSNIHDNAYTVGSIDFTGDMPIILGPDGPSLGGFVCPAVVIKADLWKLGQLKAGDTIRFINISNENAEQRFVTQEKLLAGHKEISKEDTTIPWSTTLTAESLHSPVLRVNTPNEAPASTYRQSGDGVLLVEFGDMELDLDLRFRVQALYQNLKDSPFDGLLELVPGIRSLQIQYDPLHLSLEAVLEYVSAIELALPPVEAMEFPSRIIHLPLSWDDPSTQLAIEKYMQIVRDDAPWCPSNIEFIRRINGLKSIEDVKKIVFDASYFVMGLGDVYLGAPVATPLDPRHRLVTTKYNPARTWTPENAVGIGGAYMCIYGMEGPGGYQFVGRTLPIWNRYNKTEQFPKPWLLRFFDQIRWYPVGEEELLEMREKFLTGSFEVRIEESSFKVADYHQFLAENAEPIQQFKAKQQDAFDKEREDWERTGAMNFSSTESHLHTETDPLNLDEADEQVHAPIVGSLWKILTKPGKQVAQDETIMIIESMKTEFHVIAPCSGTITSIHKEEGAAVTAGEIIASIRPQ